MVYWSSTASPSSNPSNSYDSPNLSPNNSWIMCYLCALYLCYEPSLMIRCCWHLLFLLWSLPLHLHGHFLITLTWICCLSTLDSITVFTGKLNISAARFLPPLVNRAWNHDNINLHWEAIFSIDGAVLTMTSSLIMITTKTWVFF